VCEDVEGGFAAVGALTGRTDAAEGKGRNGGVVETVVEGGAAGASLVKD
jgi:hypothetical protein